MITAKLTNKSRHLATDLARALKAEKIQIFITPLSDPSYLSKLVKTFKSGGYDSIVFEDDALPDEQSYDQAAAFVKAISNQYPDALRVVVYKFP